MTALFFRKILQLNKICAITSFCKPYSQCCQIIFHKVAQAGVKRRPNALQRRAHFCVLNFADKISKNVLKLVFSNILQMKKHISTLKKLTCDKHFSHCFGALIKRQLSKSAIYEKNFTKDTPKSEKYHFETLFVSILYIFSE